MQGAQAGKGEQMAFRFVGSKIVGPRGDSGTLIFCADGETAFTDSDRLVFCLSRQGSGVVMRRTLRIDGEGCATLSLRSEETMELEPGAYLWSARYVLDAEIDESGAVTGGTWVDTPWRNREFEVQEVNGQL